MRPRYSVMAVFALTLLFTSCGPLPTPMATATSTMTPAPPTSTLAPTDTLTLTPSLAPTETSTLTATPGSLARITNLVNWDSVAQYITLMGEYRADLTDNIWIFVQDPAGLFFPASMNPCNGDATPKVKGRWETRVTIGSAKGTGMFNLILTVADDDASQFISTTLQDWCEANNFPGFRVLPSGVTEVESIRVKRLELTDVANEIDMIYGPVPSLPGAGFRGDITVAGLGRDGRVAQEEIISGTLSGVEDALSVWVLVFPFYGRWYPQSYDPCTGLHTIQTDGQWRVRAVFGNDKDKGKPFDVVVVLADEQASAFFNEKQKEFCRDNNYPGFLTIELPDGITEKYKIRVIRR
jgi:hypothetical protein